MQGGDAPGGIIRAIELANQHQQKLGIEALIVGRGGGSLEDLQAFNEESVARAIFSSKLPITSAIGHEIDFTIADFVADLRAPTPSAAAEQMSPDQAKYFDTFAAYRADLTSRLKTILLQAKKNLHWLAKQLKRPDRRLQEHAQNLDRLEIQMQLAIRNQITIQNGELKHLQQSMLSNSPINRVKILSIQLQKITKDFKQFITKAVSQTQSQLAELTRSLSAVSPLNTLARGYSITYDDNNQVIRSAENVKAGSTVVSILEKGNIESTVKSINTDDTK